MKYWHRQASCIDLRGVYSPFVTLCVGTGCNKPLSGAGIQRERGVGADSNMTTDAGVMWHRFMDGKGMTIDNAGIRPFLA